MDRDPRWAAWRARSAAFAAGKVCAATMGWQGTLAAATLRDAVAASYAVPVPLLPL